MTRAQVAFYAFLLFFVTAVAREYNGGEVPWYAGLGFGFWLIIAFVYARRD